MKFVESLVFIFNTARQVEKEIVMNKDELVKEISKKAGVYD